MFRAMGMAVALAMTPAGAPVQAASGQQLPSGWEFVQVMGWTLSYSDDETLTLFMAARQPMHIWERTEYKRVTSGIRSRRELVQVDCAAGRRRIVSAAYFTYNNLEMRYLGSEQAQAWEYPAPGTIGEFPLRFFCD